MPANITLVPLPAYSPELNPVERVWLYLQERFPSLRLHNEYKAIVAAASKTWNRLRRQTGLLTSNSRRARGSCGSDRSNIRLDGVTPWFVGDAHLAELCRPRVDEGRAY